jgi:hypothetical protein
MDMYLGLSSKWEERDKVSVVSEQGAKGISAPKREHVTRSCIKLRNEELHKFYSSPNYY